MIVGSSALIAIMRVEPDAVQLVRAIEAAPERAMSMATYIETSMVLLGRAAHSTAFADLDEMIQRARLTIEPVILADARLARDAFRAFGKGRHAAALNFGDCFTYALARRLNRPILCKGRDFAQTDAKLVALD